MSLKRVYTTARIPFLLVQMRGCCSHQKHVIRKRTAGALGLGHYDPSVCCGQSEFRNVRQHTNINTLSYVNGTVNIVNRWSKNHSKEFSISTSDDSNDVKCYIDVADVQTTRDMNGVVVHEDFINEEEERSLFEEVEEYLRRLRYETSHWDNAIHGYRETEKKTWNDRNKEILQRVRYVAFPKEDDQMAYVHVLDLMKTGYIKPHIDSVRFCGGTIAGLTLLSSGVMRFKHEKNEDQKADVLISRRSLYIMKDTARYHYTHELLADEDSFFKGEHIPRDRRISVICRNEATSSR